MLNNWVLLDFYFIEMNTCIQGCIKLIKSDSKDIYNVTKYLLQYKIYISNIFIYLFNFIFIKQMVSKKDYFNIELGLQNV